VDKGIATDVLNLEICKAFDLVPHNIPPAKLERYGFDGWNIRSMLKWLDGCIQGVSQWLSIKEQASNEWCPSRVLTETNKM